MWPPGSSTDWSALQNSRKGREEKSIHNFASKINIQSQYWWGCQPTLPLTPSHFKIRQNTQVKNSRHFCKDSGRKENGSLWSRLIWGRRVWRRGLRVGSRRGIRKRERSIKGETKIEREGERKGKIKREVSESLKAQEEKSTWFLVWGLRLKS